MSGPVASPLRNELIDFMHSEIARVGVTGLNRTEIVKLFVAKGASRARVFAWIKDELELIRNPPPDPLEAEVARAEAMIAAESRAAVLKELPSAADLKRLEQDANAEIRATRAAFPDSGVERMGIMAVPGTIDAGRETGPATGVGAVLARLERATETVEKCISYSFGDKGQIRNPRMALASADALRKCLETALKLHETIDNVQTVQRFIAEIMGVLRTVSPEVAASVVEAMRGVTARWAK